MKDDLHYYCNRKGKKKQTTFVLNGHEPWCKQSKPGGGVWIVDMFDPNRSERAKEAAKREERPGKEGGLLGTQTCFFFVSFLSILSLSLF